MTHAAQARAVRDSLEAETGVRPPYPRSTVALDSLQGKLRRIGEEKDEFQRLAAIKIKREIPYDLDKLVPLPHLQAPDLLKSRREAKEEFEVDGAVHVFSTFYVERPDQLIDGTMNDARAAKLLGLLGEDNLLRIKFLRDFRGDWIVEDKFDPIKKDHAVVTVSRRTRSGVLTGIDKVYYQNAYPITMVVYGIYSVRVPNPANLAPMRNGDLNCVAQRIIEHFDGALRGQGLTESRREKIQEWETLVHASGATIDDVAELETILKRAIILKDIAGEDLYNSGKYRASRWKPIELVVHNGHAWPQILKFPSIRVVQTFRGDPLEAIRRAVGDQPLAVWLLGGEGRKLSVDQFVLPDGRTYRTEMVHDRIQQACADLGYPDLADRAFGVNHAANIVAIQKNDWKPTPAGLLDDIQKACVEHGHGGLWNSMIYDPEDVVSIDMKSCYPASFQGEGDAKPYFERFGHPSHRMTRVAVNGPLPKDIAAGFAEVTEWEFRSGVHPVLPAWFGGHFASKGWAPTPLLAFLIDSGLLKTLRVGEAIISFEKRAEVWLPEDRDQACSIIGKFTQGSKADGKRLTRVLVTDKGELDFLVKDTRQNGTLVGAPQKCELGHILTYYDGEQPQYTHLRASMLAYAHINLLSMLQHFGPTEAVRVATDSIYVRKRALHKLDSVPAYTAMPTDCAPAQWRNKGEYIYMPQQHAAYEKPENITNKRDVKPSQAPVYSDPLTRYRLSYLNGGGGSGKTTRAIDIFRTRTPLVLTPTHRLAKEMRSRGVNAQTYHSFFRWSGQVEWTPDRMGQKYIPRVIIWDEICTVPSTILEPFLAWLESRSVQVICCGDQGQPPPIAGHMPHDWLRQKVDYYEEITLDHRAKDETLKALKKAIRLQSDVIQCREMRKALPSCRGWDSFVKAWKPGDLVVTSRQVIRDRAQKLLFDNHKQNFPSSSVPLLYHPTDSRKQNILVAIPGTNEKQELVLNDVVEVSIDAAEACSSDWRLGYAVTVHSSQGLTIQYPQKVWIIDDYLQWSNLTYLAISRVEYLSQLERVCPPELDQPAQAEPKHCRTQIQKKLVAYKSQDKAASRKGFDLTVDYVLTLVQKQENRCSACNIEMLWAYQPKDTRQFSVDRLDNNKGHCMGNVRLTCLECNRNRGGAALHLCD